MRSDGRSFISALALGAEVSNSSPVLGANVAHVYVNICFPLNRDLLHLFDAQNPLTMAQL
jgi:hypothetical protein